MIRHVLLLRFKPEATNQSIETLKSAFEAIPGKIDGVLSVEWGENNSPENKNKAYTHCVFMTFVDEKGRSQYLPHREHEALKQVLSPLLDDIIVMDYEV